MKVFFKNGALLRVLCLCVFWLLAASRTAQASHIYGADLYYQYQSGNSYRVYLDVYGDCSGQTFPSFTTANPRIYLYNGNTLQGTFTSLLLQGPGVEVSPVCPSQLSSTSCNGGTNPGVKRFRYTNLITVPSASANWRFVFAGELISSSAGRSNNINNIVQGANGSIMGLEATLNNLSGATNSSPTYTTIPTPFFCVNIPQGYNPGAVDPNTDSLAFALVSGLQSVNGALSGPVTYVSGFSATAPLAVNGSINFSTVTGQLDFTPNLSQQSLVVNKVSEYRNGVLVGSSMREMTFVVLNGCNNTAPNASPANASGASIRDSATINACGAAGAIGFNLNPIDPNGDPITVTYAGLPAGATITVTNNGTVSPIVRFNWNTTGVTAGDYLFYLTYTDAGCPLSSKRSRAYRVHIAPRPGYTFTLVSAATCVAKAVFTLTPSGPDPRNVVITSAGGTSVRTYTALNTAQTDSLDPGTYRVTVVDTAGCTDTMSFTLAAPVKPAVITSGRAPTCFGGTDAQVTITPSGGLAPYSIAFNNGSFGSVNTFNGLPAGSYRVQVRDAQQCVLDTTIVVADTTQIVAGYAATLPPCNAYASGRIQLAASNGIAPYQYALNTGAYSASGVFNGLASGTYTLHIRDARGCIKDTVAILPDSIRVQAVATIDSVRCFGGSDGVVRLFASGATAPYRFAVGAGTYSTNHVFPGLPGGPAAFHVKDSNNCFLDTTIVVPQPTPVVASRIVTDVTCYGLTNGAVSVVGSGGTPGYQYSLNGGALSLSGTYSGLAAGIYQVRIWDSHSCDLTVTDTVKQPAVLRFTLVVQNPSCFNTSNGTIYVNGSGGNLPYSYSLDGGPYGAANSFTGIAAGSHIVRLQDAKGCLYDSTITLQSPTRIVMNATVRTSTCLALSNGVVTLGATGGVPGYQFQKNGGGFSANAVYPNLAAGTYIFSVRDANGCIVDTTLIVRDSITIHANTAIVNARCLDSAGGSITLSGTGGVGPYTYVLNTALPSPNNVFTNLYAGSYTIRIQDAIGCLLDTVVTVTQPARLTPQVTLTPPDCNGGSNGSITLSQTGGTRPYQYALGTGSYTINPTFGGLAAGLYAFHLVDSNGCRADTAVTLSQPTPVNYTGLTFQNISCYGGSDGSITVSGTGGTPGYTYALNNGAYGTGSTFNNLPAQSYTIHIRDANNCQRDVSLMLTQPVPITFTGVQIQMPTCEGYTDGAIQFGGQGGTSPYQYALNNGSFGSATTFTTLGAGTYTLSLKDANGCLRDTTIQLVGFPPVVLAGLTSTLPQCYGQANGVITVTATGGIPPLTYQMTSPRQVSGTTGGVFNELATGSYRFRIADSKGCFADTATTLGQPDLLTITTTAKPNDCIGFDTDGQVRVTVKGGTLPYTYLWMGGDGKTYPQSQVSGLANGTYRVVVRDVNDCSDSASVAIAYDDCCKPFIPTAFTPNADGTNDTWQIQYKGDITLDFVAVYNRFGQEVFRANSLNSAWDGTFGGLPCDMGAYYYMIKLKCGNKGNTILDFKGDLTLIR
ncbi:MAG: T9SS type B sorting domain-containing protein [Sphingobacteriales bacterium]|nr:MAG: T9SS type B sorting domain-containing protein [Sphingobacteriales bacterium]